MNIVIIAAPISTSFKHFLEVKGFKLVFIQSQNDLSNYSLLEIEGIVTSNKLLLDKASLEQFPNLKWIARVGSGMEIIDTVYCSEHNIRCMSSPKGISNAVAEHAMGMLLSLQHHILLAHREIERGIWSREPNRGNELEGKTVGIIGYGHTGTAFAKKLSVFTNKLLVYDKYKTDFSEPFITVVDLKTLQKEADIISFHVPLNDETYHYYDKLFLEQMIKPHIVVNTSRGAVADTKVLLEGLASKKIIGACLDVLAEENNIQLALQSENSIIKQLLKFPVILTPHIAGYSFEAIEKMSAELMEQLGEISKPI